MAEKIKRVDCQECSSSFYVKVNGNGKKKVICPYCKKETELKTSEE